MRFSKLLRFAAVVLAACALLVPGIGQAKAAYPPSVSVMYASPYLSGGYSWVTVYGQDLVSGLSVKASYGKKSTTATLAVHSGGTIGNATVKVGSLLPSTAGRYAVAFKLQGSALGSADISTTQTYTVGTAISIKSFAVKGTSKGLTITGTAAKNTPVKITVKFGSKTYTKTVKAKSSGKFSYAFKKTSKGTYTVTAQVAPNKKYFSDPVTATYTRS